jgi:hypothetical protein
MLPAVYSPDDEIVPPVAVQLTPLFVVPATVAKNCNVVAIATVAEPGLITMVTVELLGFAA